MGTLTSWSFGALNIQLRSFPGARARGVGARCFEPAKSRGSCFLCGRGVSVSYRRLDRFRRFSNSDGDGDRRPEGESDSGKESSVTTAAPPPEESDERSRAEFESEKIPSRLPETPSFGPTYTSFQVDSFKLLELLGPENVDPADVKRFKEKLFGYSTFWVTKEDPFGDLGEGILFLGNVRGKREDVFAKLQKQLVEVTADKYNLFMVEEPNSEGPDPRGGPRVRFGLLRKEVSEPRPTTLWQYVIALLLFLLTIGSSVELGIASQINRLPPEIVKYFTDPDAAEPPDMALLFPFVEYALPLAYGVLGVLIFHEVGHLVAAFPKKVKLSIPYFIPNITLGSFGAITQGHGACKFFQWADSLAKNMASRDVATSIVAPPKVMEIESAMADAGEDYEEDPLSMMDSGEIQEVIRRFSAPERDVRVLESDSLILETNLDSQGLAMEDVDLGEPMEEQMQVVSLVTSPTAVCLRQQENLRQILATGDMLTGNRGNFPLLTVDDMDITSVRQSHVP